MKKLVTLLAFVFSFAFLANAQIKATKVIIKLPTVQCESCKERIERYLSKEEGILESNVNYKKKQITVKFMSDRTNIENIKTAIANIGYDADDVEANQDMYKKLPACCKKPEDGGGMQKDKKKKG